MDVAIVADELTAVGWRLAGARVWIPGAQTAQECFLAATRAAPVVLITAEVASSVPAAQLEARLLSQPPLVLVIADLRHRQEPADVEEQTRRALGIAV